VRSYRTFSPSPPVFTEGCLFSVALSVGNFSISARVYLQSKLKLRGIAPFDVRTFLFRLAPKAILRPSKTDVILMEVIFFSSCEMFLEKFRETAFCCQADESG